MRLIQDYKHMDSYRKSFNSLAQQTFGISFEEWYQRGYWNERYICYSYVDNDEVVANVSVSRLQLWNEETSLQACQIGTVMTHPDYRGRGLSAKLMEYVLQYHAPHTDVFYLFANRQVLDYYPKFGFSPVQENRFVWEADAEHKLDNKQPAKRTEQIAWRQLDLMDPDDERLLKHKLKTRQPVSRRFSVQNNEGIFLWYALQVFPNGVYYHEETGQIWACGQSENTLHLYDCVSSPAEDGERLRINVAAEDVSRPRINVAAEDVGQPRIHFPAEDASSSRISFPELFQQLARQLPGIRRVEFAFTPDKLEIPVSNESIGESDVLFVKQSRPGSPAFPEHQPFKYPMTAQA